MAALDLSKKQLMINKLLEEEVDSKLEEPSEEAFKSYYEANKDKYMEEKKDESGKITKTQQEFEQIKDRVKFDCMIANRQEKIKSLLDNLRKTKDVVIYDAQLEGK